MSFCDRHKHQFDGSHNMCLGCHAELAPQGDQGRHVHEPVKQGLCVSCHDPHASENKYQLVKSAPDLCLSCHKEMAKTLAVKSLAVGRPK